MVIFIVGFDWSTAQERIWGDGQCPNVGNLGDKNLQECQRFCDEHPSCSAINWSSSPVCVLRGCTMPVPAPEGGADNYTGYYKFKRGNLQFFYALW